MNLAIHPFHRHLTARSVSRLTRAAALESLDHAKWSTGDFVHTHTPMPAAETTRIAALTDGRQLLIAIAAAHVLGTYDAGDRLKVYFDPYADRCGFIQLDIPMTGISGGDAPLPFLHHLPYPEARSTRFAMPRLLKREWHDRQSTDLYAHSVPCAIERVLLLRFANADLFRRGSWCGFNVARTRARTGEESSWNLATGNRFFDAATFGTLHIQPPKFTVQLHVEPHHKGLRIQALRPTASGSPQPLRRGLQLQLADPLDHRHVLPPTGSHAQWHVDASLLREPGRYRIYLISSEGVVAPDIWWFDWRGTKTQRPQRAPAVPFVLGMCHDVPDDLARNVAYTPALFRAFLRQQHQWGVRRFSWIDYPSPRYAAAFWRNLSNYPVVRASFRNCGDLLACAARTCRALQMPCFGVMKPFEGWRDSMNLKPGKYDMVAPDGSVFCGLQPTVAANQEAAIAGHPDWLQPTTFPVRTLRFVSDTALPKLKSTDITLLVSADNKHYRPYRGHLQLRVTQESRPHVRWSPAGPRPDGGKRSCWVLHLENLQLADRFLAIAWTRPDLYITGRAFAVLEATDDAGRAVHLTLARTPGKSNQLASEPGRAATAPGARTHSFNFHIPRRAWNNHSEPITDWVDLGPGEWGVMLAPLNRLPPILDPIDPRTQAAWLQDVQTHIDRGVTGVDLRFLCHHVDCQDWGTLAFNPAVRAAFTQKFGRPVEPTEADLHQVRLLRGQGVTAFMRAARALTRKHRVKLVVHVESGMDVPPHLHVRNQIHMDWRTWLAEKLVDEVMLKYFGSAHPFIQEHVLPLARRQGIPVHMCELGIKSMFGAHAVERSVRLTLEARAAGLAGLTHYETAGYQWLNAQLQPVPVGNFDHALMAAARALENA